MGERRPLDQVNGFAAFNFIAFICSNLSAMWLARFINMSKDRQRYEIYVNDRLLILLHEGDVNGLAADPGALVTPYRGQAKSLFQYLDILENSNRFDKVILYASDTRTLYRDLKDLLFFVPAAGGVIENREGRILMIFRRGFWDLPKGKLDKGEKSLPGALRECEEETGLTGLTPVRKIGKTYHFYRDKGQVRSLKKTDWYHLLYEGDLPPVPQAEEDIELCSWHDPAEAMKLMPIHPNILLVIDGYLRKKAETISNQDT